MSKYKGLDREQLEGYCDYLNKVINKQDRRRRKMKKHLDIFVLLLFITLTISAIIAVIYVAKAEVEQDRIEYEREVFAPMQSGLKY